MLTKELIITENELSNVVIGIAIDIHKKWGPGLLESAYKELLFYHIQKAGYRVEKEKPMPLVAEGIKLNVGYRIDLLVEQKLVLEVKSVQALTDIDMAQTITYLRLGNYRLGLLMNFNVVKLKDGIKRVANGL
jgi:GxxExxY protein